MSNLRICIIGSSIAGISAAAAAHKENPQAEIHIFTEDTHLPYYRQRLAEVLLDPAAARRLLIHPAEWYKEHGIHIRLGSRVNAITPESKSLRLSDGSEERYDKLIIATGSRSFLPPIQGIDLPGIHSLWTMDQALELSARLHESCRHAVVIGGGLLGLEAAHVCSKLGIQTHIIEHNPRLLARQLDEKASSLLQEQIRRLGIDILLDADVEHFEAGADGQVARVCLKDGRCCEADLVLVSTGVRARLELIDGLDVHIDRCLYVNERMETGLPDIYAAGDCVCLEGRWYGLWSIAKSQGETAGANAAGGDKVCHMPVPPYIVNTMDTRIASAGLIDTSGTDYTAQITVDEVQLTYDRRNYLGTNLLGFILLGDTKPFSLLAKDLQETSRRAQL